MIGFTEADVCNVVADVRMMLDAALPEYQRLRAEFPQVTDDAITTMMHRIVRGPPVVPEEPLAPLLYNFARFQLAHAAATHSRDLLRKGTRDAEAVRRAYLGAGDALGALGALLREVKGLTYAASHFSDFSSQLVKHRKVAKIGHENRAAGNAQRGERADQAALAAALDWAQEGLRKAKYADRSEAEIVRQYLKLGHSSRRQADRLRAMLKAGRLKK